jgi:hypothetical protein
VVKARKNQVRSSADLKGLHGRKVEHRVVLGAAFRPGRRQITQSQWAVARLAHCTLYRGVLTRKSVKRMGLGTNGGGFEDWFALNRCGCKIVRHLKVRRGVGGNGNAAICRERVGAVCGVRLFGG